MIYVLALVCVFGIAFGQILFKLASHELKCSGSWLDFNTLKFLVLAFLLYGITTLLWVYVLQKAELGRVYPIMALAFILVPIASAFIFGESFTVRYWVGVSLICFGVSVAITK